MTSVNTFEILWSNPIGMSHESIVAMTEFIDQNMEGLLPLYPREFARLKAYAIEKSVDIAIIRSIRNQLRSQKEINVMRKLHFYTDKVKEKFQVLISKLKALDPATLNLKSDQKLLVLNFYSSLKVPVHAIIKIIGELDSYKELDQDVIKLLFQPLKDQEKVELNSKNKAELYEKDFGEWLIKSGIKFITEKTIKSNNLYPITPDFVFDVPIIINIDNVKHQIKWLDVKNYFLTDLPFILKKLQDQAKKYNDLFGPGTFVFHLGLDPSIVIPSTLMLDGTFVQFHEDILDSETDENVNVNRIVIRQPFTTRGGLL